MSESQQSLFDVDPPPWRSDAEAERLVATIVFPDGPAGEFDYLVPPALQDPAERRLQVGQRVRVPLGRGNRAVTGYCIELEHRSVDPSRLKQVAAVLDPAPLLTRSMLRLTRWMADYYLCPWAQVLDAVVPAGVRKQAGTRRVIEFSLPSGVARRLDTLELPEKQSAVLRALARSPHPQTGKELAAAAACSPSTIQTLRKKGLLTATARRRPADALETDVSPPREPPQELTVDQQRALQKIRGALNSARHATLLMHGVTGSGKTEVYIQAIEEVIRFGRQAIVLVPEISLTPQTVRRFRARFDRVAVLHSHLSDRDRHRYWRQIARGTVPVVVGARSAIFAPTPQLGLIVLDEEHESSFKQDITPRYHARDVARWRACEENIPLVLGSATPSLESWQHAQTGAYQLIELPTRIHNRPLPDVTIVDLRTESRQPMKKGAISRPLHQAITAALRDGGQIILLLNRRGFSTHIQCPACGTAVCCPDCELPVTFHRQGGNVMCHYCGYEVAAPTQCPECQFAGIRYAGLGTERLEAEVRARYPAAGCIRMDTDTMRRQGAHERALAAFRHGDHRILLGTQMIAKGLDFPNVTLVGVIHADTALHFPDFRAAERTFQLVAQVAGRTGRGEAGGRVLVQTFAPDHPAIVAAARHDAQRFAAAELPTRERHGYPPFGALVRIVVRGEVEAKARAAGEELAARLRAELADDEAQGAARVLGPAPAPLAKLRGKYRFQIHAHGGEGERLRSAVASASACCEPSAGIERVVDVDPQDMM